MERNKNYFPSLISGYIMEWIIVFIWINQNEAVTFSDEVSLRSTLFQNYSRAIRPVYNQSDVLTVNISISLYSIQELNAKTQTLKLSASLSLNWTNELLTWEENDYGGLNHILVKPSQVWIPDITIYNGANGHPFVDSDDFFVRVYSNGQSIWYPVSILETRCSIAIAKYPFDTQVCDIQYSLWMNPATDVLFQSPTGKADTELFTKNGEWDLVNNTIKNTTIMYEAPYSFFTCTLVIRRRMAYHLINTVLPVLLLSILNVLVFVLPPEAGEKMSLSITVLLAYAVFLSIINENMPQISTSVSVLAIYVVLILGLGTASTFLSAVTLHYAYSDPGRQRRFFSLDCIRSFRLSRQAATPATEKPYAVASVNCSSHTDKETTQKDKKEKETIRPKPRRESNLFDIHTPLINPEARDLVDLIDVVSFWVFLGLTLLIFVVIISILSSADI